MKLPHWVTIPPGFWVDNHGRVFEMTLKGRYEPS